MKTQAKTIMLQGTASGVGKSTISIGLCRILCRRGLKTSPFKAQNLSDNAHILPDGRQMARSQAIAAAACGLEPDPEMNPVLLKPKTNGCDIILNGTKAQQFDTSLFRKAVCDSYTALSKKFDVIVAEGAGSPVELNLRSGDIVNMDFALRAGCPVILVSDINRGGVFASLYGTISLLSPDERSLVKGIIVNNFCGDPESFDDGKKILEKICGVPVLGIIPRLDLKLEDEDSLPGENTMTRDMLFKLTPKGLSPEAFQQQQFDYLADNLENYLDIPKIMRIMNGE